VSVGYPFLLQPPMVSTALDEPTKIYISSLDYGVSNDDIRVILLLLPLTVLVYLIHHLIV